MRAPCSPPRSSISANTAFPKPKRRSPRREFRCALHRRGSMAAIDGTVLDRLYGVIASRRGGDPASSYTAKLFSQGAAKIAQKLGEEAVEAVIEGVRGDGARLAQESADLLYHLLVLWAETEVAPEQVWQALEARVGRSGLEEKKSRPKS